MSFFTEAGAQISVTVASACVRPQDTFWIFRHYTRWFKYDRGKL
jgi:hypothetical protein